MGSLVIGQLNLVNLNGRQRVFLTICFVKGFKTKYQNPWSLIIVAKLKVILHSYLILKKMNERITDS